MSMIQSNATGKCWRHLGRKQLIQLDFRATLTAEDSAGTVSN